MAIYLNIAEVSTPYEKNEIKSCPQINNLSQFRIEREIIDSKCVKCSVLGSKIYANFQHHH